MSYVEANLEQRSLGGCWSRLSCGGQWSWKNTALCVFWGQRGSGEILGLWLQVLGLYLQALQLSSHVTKAFFPTWHRRPSCYFSVAITGVALKSTAVSSSNCCSTATGQLLSGLVRLDLPPAAASKCGFVVLFTNKCLRFRGWGENALAQKGRGAASWLSLFTGVTERASICSAKRKKTTTLKVPSYDFLCVCLSIFQTPCESLWLLSVS